MLENVGHSCSQLPSGHQEYPSHHMDTWKRMVLKYGYNENTDKKGHLLWINSEDFSRKIVNSFKNPSQDKWDIHASMEFFISWEGTYTCSFLVDKSFHETKMSCSSCVELYKCFCNVSGDHFTVFGKSYNFLFYFYDKSPSSIFFCTRD